MNKIKILDRTGLFIITEWDFCPHNNPTAYKKACDKLKQLNIIDAKIYEVAPDVFWYSTPMEKINCEIY